VIEGNDLNVNYSVNNTGGPGTQDIRLEIDGTQEDQDSNITVSPGSSSSGSLIWNTADGDGGNYTATILSDNDSDSTNVTIQSIPNSVQDAQDLGLSTGLQTFENSQGVQKDVYYDSSDGGYILLSSNNASDGLIPSGDNINDRQYQLDRNGNSSSLGTADPNQDYIIGDWYRDFSFTQVRVFAWGRSAGGDSGTLWPDNLGTYIKVEWSANDRNDVISRSNIFVSGNGGLDSKADYFVLDAVYKDAETGFDANNNQATIGGAGVNQSNGDPGGGTYLGHGDTEGSYEGWYNENNTPEDSQGYTTWVR